MINQPSPEDNTKSKEESSSDDNFYQNLTEGEPVDIDLFTACAIGKLDYVSKFILNSPESTVIINKSNYGGWTALMYACYVGNDRMTELLIREGADVLFEENKHGCTALMLAASCANISLVKRLVEEKPRINCVDKQGRTALFYAAEYGQTNVVKYLLSINADATIRQYATGYTPFMEAAEQGLEGVCNAFLEHGVDLELVCNKGYTARQLAQQRGSHVIVNMIDNHFVKFQSLLRYEADLDMLDVGGQKVKDWLNDHNPDHSFDDITPNKWPELHSHPVPIDGGNFGTSVGTSVGDSTIVDSDRTPVGTPVDSLIHQYMARDLAERRPIYNTTTLESFLIDFGLEKYLKILEDNSIDFEIFLSLTEEDFKELGIIFGARRKLKLAIDQWKEDTGWSKEKRWAFANVHSKLQHVSADLAREKEARLLLEAEQMEGRARKNHMYFIGEKVLRACKELQSTNKMLKKHVDTLKTLANDNRNEDLKSRLKELHNQMSEDTLNADNITETILRRVEKLLCDDVSEHSSGSGSPESSCTSFSKSESGSGVIAF